MKSWEETLIHPDATLREALDKIDQVGCNIALVVDSERCLLGTLSDGDARRALLKGLNLSDKVAAVMNSSPICAKASDDRHVILETMRRLGLRQIPVVDLHGIIVGLETVADFLIQPERANWVVIMAGGLGQRLEELTRETPKPMLRVGPRPLLESIVQSYADQGFRRFFIAVNYKAEQIESHFGDGRDFGVDIQYLREDKRLGTAGALGLLPEQPMLPIIVTNADLLTKEDYGALVDNHVKSSADATMAVRGYEMQVPFGVVHTQGEHIVGIEEKPKHQFLVSAGIYVLSPQALDVIPAEQYFDMPSLFEALIAQELRCRCHPIEGYWLDIGRLHDYERANIDFAEVFQ